MDRYINSPPSQYVVVRNTFNGSVYCDVLWVVGWSFEIQGTLTFNPDETSREIEVTDTSNYL